MIITVNSRRSSSVVENGDIIKENRKGNEYVRRIRKEKGVSVFRTNFPWLLLKDECLSFLAFVSSFFIVNRKTIVSVNIEVVTTSCPFFSFAIFTRMQAALW